MAPLIACINKLFLNDPDKCIAAAKVLIRISKNILNEPTNPKYRSISLASSTLHDSLMVADGALECLLEMGFLEGDDTMFLPLDTSVTKLKIIHDILERKLKAMAQPSTSSPSKPSPVKESPSKSPKLESHGETSLKPDTSGSKGQLSTPSTSPEKEPNKTARPSLSNITDQESDKSESQATKRTLSMSSPEQESNKTVKPSLVSSPKQKSRPSEASPVTTNSPKRESSKTEHTDLQSSSSRKSSDSPRSKSPPSEQASTRKSPKPVEQVNLNKTPSPVPNRSEETSPNVSPELASHIPKPAEQASASPIPRPSSPVPTQGQASPIHMPRPLFPASAAEQASPSRSPRPATPVPKATEAASPKPKPLSPIPRESPGPSSPKGSRIPGRHRLVRIDDIYLSTGNHFFKNLMREFQKVLQFESKSLQAKTLSCIPLVELKSRVEKIIRARQQEYKEKKRAEEEIDVQDVMVGCLVDWFKNEFFSWVNTPECSTCLVEAEQLEVRFLLSRKIDRVEVYKCPKCSKEINFNRYNDAEEILNSRMGRCGEWAMCFTLCCRAMGWDARLIHDATDHAWTEVFMMIPKKWMHVDPCEGIISAPLLYEAGWGKKLSYIMAYSHEEVQDVTWRYTSKFKDVMTRRTLCKEADLVKMIMRIRTRCGETLSEARRLYVLERAVRELVDLGVEKQPTERDIQGRQSGSTQWKEARQELADSSPFVWKLTSSDVEDNKIVIGYSSVKDMYFKNGLSIKRDFRCGLVESGNMQRKVEKDWKMVYLSRIEDSENGFIKWQFDLDNDVELEVLDVVFHATLYPSGRVFVQVSSDDVTATANIDGSLNSFPQFAKCKSIVLAAALSGGTGPVAWQHAQLFRTALSETTVPFTLTFHVKKC